MIFELVDEAAALPAWRCAAPASYLNGQSIAVDGVPSVERQA